MKLTIEEIKRNKKVLEQSINRLIAVFERDNNEKITIEIIQWGGLGGEDKQLVKCKIIL